MSASELALGGLILLCILGVIIQVFALLRAEARKQTPITLHIEATVTKVTREQGRWYITVAWPDALTGQMYTSRSHPLRFHPKLQVGSPVTIIVNPSLPHTVRLKR